MVCGHLNLEDVNVSVLDEALTIARKDIAEEVQATASVGGGEGGGEGGEAEGSVLSPLLVRLIRLATSLRRLRSSMKSKSYELAETVLNEIENDHSIITISQMEHVDVTLFRPPPAPSSGLGEEDLLASHELRCFRHELNDIQMRSSMMFALTHGKIGIKSFEGRGSGSGS